MSQGRRLRRLTGWVGNPVASPKPAPVTVKTRGAPFVVFVKGIPQPISTAGIVVVGVVVDTSQDLTHGDTPEAFPSCSLTQQRFL